MRLAKGEAEIRKQIALVKAAIKTEAADESRVLEVCKLRWALSALYAMLPENDGRLTK